MTSYIKQSYSDWEDDLRKIQIPICALFIILFCLLPFGQISVAQENGLNSISIHDLEWLSGQWIGDFEGNRFEAHYSGPDGNVILSASKEFTKKGCFFEFERFEESQGTVILTPYPNGKESVSFKLVNYNPSLKKASFENLDHDFPTDITYHRVTEDSLKIYVGGPSKDGRIVFQVSLKRVDHSIQDSKQIIEKAEE
jgi:Domain of unknown function (DUF6265)